MLKEYYDAYWHKRIEEKILPPIREDVPPFLKKYTSYGSILNQISPNGVILDLGCGDGNVSQLYLSRGEVYGLDISEVAAVKAKEKGVKAQVFDLNSEAPLPYAANFFDTVIVTDVLEHVINPNQLLKEIQRILKVGGQLIVTVPNFSRWDNRLKMLIGDPIDLLHWSKYGDEVEHLHWFTRPKLAHLLKTINFKKIRAIPTGLPVGFLFGVIGLPSLGKMLTLKAEK